MAFDTEAHPTSLRNAAQQGDELHADLGKAVQRLDSEHAAVSGHSEGFSFAEELMRVQRSWNGRLGDVREECGELSNLLKETAGNYEKNEEQTASSFSAHAGQVQAARPAANSTLRDFG